MNKAGDHGLRDIQLAEIVHEFTHYGRDNPFERSQICSQRTPLGQPAEKAAVTLDNSTAAIDGSCSRRTGMR